MPALSSLPITNRLMRLIVTTSAAVLILATLILLAIESVSYRQTYTGQLLALTGIVGVNSVTALEAADAGSAEGIVASLSSEPGIQRARVLDAEGNAFAEYRNVQTRKRSFTGRAGQVTTRHDCGRQRRAVRKPG